MLGSDVLAVRIGRHLRCNTSQRTIQTSTTCKSCACFARSLAIPPQTKLYWTIQMLKVREDVQAVMEAIEARYDRNLEIELDSWYLPDLQRRQTSYLQAS